MSEKIRALRKSLESTGKGQAQASSQQAYGEQFSCVHPLLCECKLTEPEDPSRGKSKKTPHPIIMISSSPTALITMWNVKKFLEQGM
jgi:parafibromin